MGVAAAGAALGVAEVAAYFVSPLSSPIIAVGQAVIRITPEPVKEFAIRVFGQNDKRALLIGTFVLVIVAAVLIGEAASRRIVFGVAGIAGFGLLGVIAALTHPDATLMDSLPSAVGAAGGIVALCAIARHLAALRPSTVDAEHRFLMQRRDGTILDRRGFLLATGVSLGVAVLGGAAGETLAAERFSVSQARAQVRVPVPTDPVPPLAAGADLRLPELTPFVSSNRDFYRIDTAFVVPQVDPATWRLKLHGRFARPMTLTYADLQSRTLIERDITLTCVSNEVGGDLAGNARWIGVPLAPLLREAGIDPGADQIVTRSADGWTCGTPTQTVLDTADAMLAIAMNGEPLPVAHGFPVRMIVPGLYGYVSATKWIVDMEASTFDAFDAYWVERGWAQQGPIKVASRIDTPRDSRRLTRGTPVNVAGVAWAQTRGVSKVEVRVDDGDWQAARLAAVPSNETWRQWVWQWTPTDSGRHALQVRATDGHGEVQTDARADPYPSGATGWHTVVVSVR
jgi:DMSO/TMAO reductase YedYZ molybdopterin-dependent catalytic subunit